MWSRQCIVRVSITKKITCSTKIIMENHLKSINKKYTKALFVDINSSQGSLYQAIDISNSLKQFKKENPHIALYTFAEDLIFGPAIAILTAGDLVFADKNSMFGCYDFIKKRNEYKSYLQKENINIDIHTAGENKVRLNPFEELRENDVTWINNLLSELKKVLIDYVYENRKRMIKNKDTFTSLFNSSIYSAEEAMNSDLIDKFGLVDKVAMECFANLPVKKSTTTPTLKKFVDLFRKNAFSESKNT